MEHQTKTRATTAFSTTRNGAVPAPGAVAGKVLGDGGAWVPNGGGQNSNLAATTDPLTTDDDTSASPGPYAIGSRWVNTTTNTWFSCADASVGAAVWIQDSNTSQLEKEAPKEHFFGSLMDYPRAGAMTAETVQYTRVWLTAGLAIDTIRVFQEMGGNAARSVRLGIYDQAIPTSTSGVPDTKVEETALTATASGANGSYLDVALLSTLNITVTGYYWLALVQTSTALKLAISEKHRADYLPRREQTGPGGGALPATASGLSNPSSGVLLVSAVEV